MDRSPLEMNGTDDRPEVPRVSDLIGFGTPVDPSLRYLAEWFRPDGVGPMTAHIRPETLTPRPTSSLRRRPSHDARVLTGELGEAEIVLDGTPYLLRITRAGKLILTK